MKQVKVTPPVPTITPNDVVISKYYGIKSPCDSRGFITRQNYDSDNFIVLALKGITNGNCWGWFSNDLKELVKTLVLNDFEVYEFDTYQELFRWLSETT